MATKFTTKPIPAAAKTVAANNAEVLRKIRGSKAKPEAAQPEVVEPEASPNIVQDAVDNLMRAMGLTGRPTWMRQITASVISIVASFGTGWLIGMCMGALLAMTANAFLIFMIWAVGIALALVLGAEVGTRTYNFVAEFRVDSIKNRVSSWFKRDAAEPAHA